MKNKSSNARDDGFVKVDLSSELEDGETKREPVIDSNAEKNHDGNAGRPRQEKHRLRNFKYAIMIVGALYLGSKTDGIIQYTSNTYHSAVASVKADVAGIANKVLDYTGQRTQEENPLEKALAGMKDEDKLKFLEGIAGSIQGSYEKDLTIARLAGQIRPETSAKAGEMMTQDIWKVLVANVKDICGKTGIPFSQGLCEEVVGKYVTTEENRQKAINAGGKLLPYSLNSLEMYITNNRRE